MMDFVAAGLAGSLFNSTSVGKMWNYALTYLSALLASAGVAAQYGSQASTYTNPILNKTGADP